MLFFLGVGMAALGVALCLLGEVKLPGGRVLKPLHAQISGAILLGFFPLAFLLQRFTGEWDLGARLLVGWILAGLCWSAVLVIILTTTTPVKPVRGRAASRPKSARPSSREFNSAAEEREPGLSTGDGKNPFDFS